ncbi:MAG: trigger factor [Dehalococcoidales bacterium]|nr:MAG: trigger factor [Dehalococcoidales bacterium]
MKVTNEKTENSQVFLTIEMDQSEVEESTEKAFQKLVKRVNVPGFRKGKAPRAVLERHVGKETLVNDMLEELVPQAYEKALEEQEIEAIARPQIEVVQTEPVIFKAVVPLRPVVRLGDYHQIRLEPEPVEVTEETVDAVVEQLRHQHASWEPVERPVGLGDLVTLTVESTIEGETFINQNGAQYQVIGESVAPAPGFAEQLVGMIKDEEKEFEISFPDDYSREEVAGKEASFRVTVTEIKQENLPEVTDEFATQVDAEFKDVKALREKIDADMKTRAEDRAKQNYEERAIEAVVEISEVEFPPVLAEAEVHELLDDQSRRLQMQGLTMEQYLKAMNKTGEELHEEMHPIAEKRVTRGLVLGKLSEEEKIEVSDSDIDTEITKMVESAAEDRREDMKKVLSTPQAHDSLKQTLLSRKTVQRIVEIAKGSIETDTTLKEEEE